MPARAYRATEASPSVEQFRENSNFLRWELDPRERVGPPIVPRRRKWWLHGAAMLVASGLGWASYQDPAGTWEWTSASYSSAISLGQALLAGQSATHSPAEPTTPPLAPLRLIEPELLRSAGVEAAAQPGDGAATDATVTPDSAAQMQAEVTKEHADPSTEAEKPAPLPPLPPLTDPLQKRAEAAGLHPELSRALLQRLTATDFKNAAIAIRKAIAETPDDAVLVWPTAPKRGLAHFRINFVPGISPSCRRYVVGVGKDGWLTTALPMEKCGVKRKPAQKVTATRAPSSSEHR